MAGQSIQGVMEEHVEGLVPQDVALDICYEMVHDGGFMAHKPQFAKNWTLAHNYIKNAPAPITGNQHAVHFFNLLNIGAM